MITYKQAKRVQHNEGVQQYEFVRKHVVEYWIRGYASLVNAGSVARREGLIECLLLYQFLHTKGYP